MLEPHSRSLLLDALRPPPECKLDRAIGTTFTLDLTALLTAPLAFSLFDSLAGRDERATGIGGIDPFALLKSVREHADQITVFCQATRIASPPRYRQLLAYLETSVVQVLAPNDLGVFHPKVWALRFVRSDGAVQYRVLCNSRNITFDRSWDTMLTIDGELTDRTNAFSMNRPLADFFEALPKLALQPIPRHARVDASLVADELRRVRFDLPADFESMSFHPLGIDGYQNFSFEGRRERMLVISPFVTSGALRDLAEEGDRHVLVSRLDELRHIGRDVLAGFKTVMVLQDGAEAEGDDESDDLAAASSTEQLPPATGLHAKLYVAEDGWNAHIWTGSANATDAAFERNVEFLVQLTGKKARVGIDAILNGPKGSPGLSSILGEYAPLDAVVTETPEELRLEDRLRTARLTLARSHWAVVVGGATGAQYPLALHVRGGVVRLLEGVELWAWPITLTEAFAQSVRDGAKGVVADFGPRSFDAITSFFAFRVRVREGDLVADETFAMNLPLEGAPSDRPARILQSLLDDPAKVLRFLRLLLATDPMEILRELDAVVGDEGDAESTTPGSFDLEVPLLESMLRTLDRNPSQLDAIESFVRDLSATEAGTKALPADFLKVWASIRAARAATAGGAR